MIAEEWRLIEFIAYSFSFSLSPFLPFSLSFFLSFSLSLFLKAGRGDGGLSAFAPPFIFEGKENFSQNNDEVKNDSTAYQCVSMVMSSSPTPVKLRYEKPLTLTPGHQSLTNVPIPCQFTSPQTFFTSSVRGRMGPVESVPFANITDGHIPYIPQALQGLADGGLLEACKRKRL